jgi:F-type H+-transporting ATPase subunit delta
MQETKAGVRYAKSLFKLAVELNELEAVSKDMALLDKTIQENPELENLLKSPIIKSDKKSKIMHEIFDGKLGASTMSFIDLLIRKRRELIIDQIARQFVVLHLQNNNIEEAVLTTPFQITEAFRAKVIDLIMKNSTNASVELTERIDASLIGGFLLQFGGKQFDTSLSREFEMLRREFDKNLYIKAN